ncbi:MAG: nickel pincer cofactor biosynthesis protein LarC [Anaerolineae bacterium]|nr:nickel pincer cofactor biosynthesis protein LarC [Anaerolineae bacterium]
MKLAYFDCIAGASGDMILGALLDAGLAEATLRERLAALHLDDFDLRCNRVNKNGFSATKVDVLVKDDAPARHLPDIEGIVQESDLSPAIKAQAIAIFRRMGEVEAGIHGATLDHVHLHELGGVDTIVDVVGALVGLEELGVERIYASPLPLGRGFVTGAHGQIPLPAPATVGLLKGVPVVGSDLEVELVTPTGAALLSSLAAGFGPLPAMTLTTAGFGAGGRDLPIPNVLRLLLGETAAPLPTKSQTLAMLETNIDDLNPEFYDYVIERLFAANALDVFLSPIQMKKNRPATLLRVLSQPADVDPLMQILLAETSTLGVRQQMVTRHCLPRSIETVATPYGPIRVKIARLGKRGAKAAPEYDDCRQVAEEKGVSLREVYRAAETAAQTLIAAESKGISIG